MCASGFGSCDGSAANGCETVLTTTSNCGACGIVCVNPNGSTVCQTGVCVPTCAQGFSNCDSNPVNGCETNTAVNVNHCGVCGNACSCPSGTATCTAGVCSCSSCNPGTGNCDGNIANGCETDLKTPGQLRSLRRAVRARQRNFDLRHGQLRHRVVQHGVCKLRRIGSQRL